MSIKQPSKNEIVQHVVSYWFTNQQATTMYDIMIDYIKSNIESGKSLKLTGLGIFHLHTLNDKVCMDFQTKKRKLIKSHKILKFKSSRAYNKSLNK